MANLGKRLTEKWNSLSDGISTDALIAAFTFNLDTDVPNKRIDGFVGVTRDEMLVFVDKERKDTVPLADIKEFNLQVATGTLTLEYTTKDGKLHLDRAGLAAFAHGEYFELGKKIGYFGFSANKKKKNHTKKSGK